MRPSAARLAESTSSPIRAVGAKTERRPAIAVFDLDGTLTRRDTFLAYLIFVLKRRPARLFNCAHLPWCILKNRIGLASRDRLKQEFIGAVLGGCSRAEVEAHTAAFVARFGHGLLQPAALRILRRHREQEHRLVIATASLDIYARQLGLLWDVPEVISTRVQWRSNVITGALDGPNLRGEAKLRAVKDALGLTQIDRPKIFAYSDHHSDLPLLRYADRGIAVDPTGKLAACAKEEGLRIALWRR
jgi:phosphatidylglycerophosphatase C